MPSHSDDRSSPHSDGVAAPALGFAPASAVAAQPDRSADGNGDDFATTPARHPSATAINADQVMGMAASVNGAYIYGFDSAGNPTLTDVGYYRSSGGMLPD